MVARPLKKPALTIATTCLLGMGMLLGLPSAAADTQWTEANKTSLRYELAGTGGRTVVLLHEAVMSLESWDLVMPDLTKEHRVLRYDLRGFGLSEKIRGAVTIQDEVEDLRGLVDALNIQGKVTLIGGALGGAVALAFAATYPQRVQGIVALSPATGVPAPGRAGAMAAAARADRDSMRAIFTEQMQSAYPESIRKSEKHTAWFRSMQLATDANSLAATLRMIAITEFDGFYAKINCPTLIVASGLNTARPVASVKQTADAIKGARFEVLHTGYFMAAQSPELLTPLLLKFLQQTAD